MNQLPTPRPLFTAIIATVGYEFQRSLKPGRIAVMASMALFPPFMTLILVPTGVDMVIDVFIGIMAYLICILASLVWSTTVVTSELEGKTWQYAASRPSGRVSLAIGKFIVSSLWTFLITLFAITLSLGIRVMFIGGTDELHVWLVMTGCAVACTLTYGSIFLLLGALFHRKAMVAGIIYGMLFEGVVGSIPAVISNLTVRYPVFYLAARGLLPKEAVEGEAFDFYYNNYSSVQAVLALSILFSVTFSIAIALIRYREFITSEET